MGAFMPGLPQEWGEGAVFLSESATQRFPMVALGWAHHKVSGSQQMAARPLPHWIPTPSLPGTRTSAAFQILSWHQVAAHGTSLGQAIQLSPLRCV